MTAGSNPSDLSGITGRPSESTVLSASKDAERPLFHHAPMSSARHIALLAVVVLASIGGWTAGRHYLQGRARQQIAVVRATASALDEQRIRELDIEFYRVRVDADPLSADDRAHLAQLYLARGRATGDPEDARRSEAYARNALAIRSSHNSAALLLLASALLEQHRFGEALEAATALVAREPDDESHRALLAEIYLELGRYDDARRTFATITRTRRALTVAPRLARLAEIEGRNEAARALLKTARDDAMARPGMPREQLAWFHLRLADSEMRVGRLRSAGEALNAALTAHPNDHRVLGALTTLASLRGDWASVLRYGEQAIAVAPDPATLGLIASAHHARGDTAQANEFYGAVEMMALGQPGPLHRAWSLFLLDNGRRIDEVHQRIEEELTTRGDVYGYDALAWSYFVRGQNVAAQRAMRTALAQGTRDALVYYHAAVIEIAIGNAGVARTYLQNALEINPKFHPVHAERARALLKKMKSGCGTELQSGCRNS